MEDNELEVKTEEAEILSAEAENSVADVTAVPVEEAPAGKMRTFGSEFYDWIDTILYSVLAIIVVFTFFTRNSNVDGSSMYPTLENGQALMISSFMYTPAHNDIVVVWSDKIPNDDGGYGKALVKRVIGLPGDHIEIDYTRGVINRNGEELPIEVRDGVLYEDGHIINAYTYTDEGLGGTFDVPEGCVFVMGDNRNESTDSRSRMVGFIDIRNIVGRAYFRLFPFNKMGGLYG